MSIRLIIIALVIVLTVSHPAYASGPENHSEFFRSIETIDLHVTVTNDEVPTSFWYGFDEKEIRPPLSRYEIEASVFKAFREMFSDAGIKIVGDETKEEKQKLQEEYEKKHPPKPKLPDADPFDMGDYVPPKPHLVVSVFVVLNRFSENNESQFIHGAITVKTWKTGKRHPDPLNYGEILPKVFVLPEEKDKAVDVLKESVKKAYHEQSRWILCTKVEGMSCTEQQSEFLEKWKKKQSKSESPPKE